MNNLDEYLSLEQTMLDLEAAGDPNVELIRDEMDLLFNELTDEEIRFLDDREGIYGFNDEEE